MGRVGNKELGQVGSKGLGQLGSKGLGQNQRGNTGQNQRGITGQNQRGNTGQNQRGITGQNQRGITGQQSGLRNRGVMDGNPVDGLGITALTPTPRAVIPGTESQAGTRKRRLRNGDRRLGTGRVQRNVTKLDRWGAWRDRHRNSVTVWKFRIT